MADAENRKGIEQLTKLAKEPKIVQYYNACGNLDGSYLSRAFATMRRDFNWLSYRRHENTEMHNLILSNLVSVYDGVARYLDGEGLNRLVPLELFIDFSFHGASPYMTIESEIFAEAGMYPAEVIQFWRNVDEHKAEVLGHFAKDFRFQDAVLPTHLGYLGPREGNSWYSRLFEGTLGVVVAAGNVALGTASTAITLGLAAPIAAPLAVASVAAGVVAVGDTAINASGFHD